MAKKETGKSKSNESKPSNPKTISKDSKAGKTLLNEDRRPAKPSIVSRPASRGNDNTDTEKRNTK